MLPQVGSPVGLLLWLVILHCLFDYPLQGDFMAMAKNRHRAMKGVPWYQAMYAHCLLQAGAVWFATGHWELGLAEFVCHLFIDCWRCNISAPLYRREHPHPPEYDFDVDQLLHVVCKLVWVFCVGHWWPQ